MIFEWLDGRTLKANEITEKHCEISNKEEIDICILLQETNKKLCKFDKDKKYVTIENII